MKNIKIEANLRKEVGKKETKTLRKNGRVPCVLYGGEKPVHFEAHENTFLKIVYTPNVYIVNVDIEGTTYNALIR